ncbi:hypothetical protein P691DRAFT_761024 [Macrolepiota fuliginosa MF-IS2]|uniref:Adenine DNA glycosylase n=1 Tax=Macrolepiota fuliginosa MF-IS2 TaxID=1400762 RepID=A0A9P5XBU4_9AGAR|nr:hypothetical protein P691DRAFT_761024 [Macrolepiota fuliginosa MF-IS2]
MSKRRASRLRSEDQWNNGETVLLSSNSDSDDWENASNKAKRSRKSGAKNSTVRKKRKTEPQIRESAQHCEEVLEVKDSRHPKSRHSIRSVGPLRTALLQWFASVYNSRGMPWRKPSGLGQGLEERSQRAYEVWVSEVMLQQTQVATVIPYYNRWMETFPTLKELAKANVDQVNALWKGLGYYSRASRLLEGAKKVVKDYDGRLPDNAKAMQATIPGIGRYSAGAICSIAYGERVPVLDGNVHRLLSRLLAIHAPPKAKATLDILWGAASIMVQEDEGDEAPDPGDINQAMIELGSTVCRVREPLCDACPLQPWCSAYSLARSKETLPLPDIEDSCGVCEPMIPGWDITAFPMKADRKKAREELDIINIIEWRYDKASHQRFFLLVRRPETGLLAGLYDFTASVNVTKSISDQAVKAASLKLIGETFEQTFHDPICLSSTRVCGSDVGKLRVARVSIVGDVSHVFSHIKKTYRVVWALVTGGDGPPELGKDFGLDQPLKRPPQHQGKGSASNPGSSQGVSPPTERTWTPMNEVAGTKLYPCLHVELQMSSPKEAAEHHGDGYLYHVLNLNKGASQNEVHERYRTLSLIFHPDKQQDEQAKEVATRNFLRIQKAYQVLSDSFLREVYDQLGDEGLSLKWPEGLRSKALEELRKDLSNVRGELRRNRQSEILLPKGNLHCIVNATPLFQNMRARDSILDRITGVGFASYSLRHDIQKRVNEKTAISFGVLVRNRVHRLDISGTIQHQFSPRLSSLAVVHFGFPFQTRLEGSYQDGTNSLNIKAVAALGALLLFAPALNIGLNRKLFRRRNEQASVDIHVGHQPHVKLRLTTPTPFGLKSDDSRNNNGEAPAGASASLSGLETGITFTSYGLDLEQGDPKLVGEFGVNLLELGTTLKAGLSLGLTGVNWVLSAMWSLPSKSAEISATTTLGGAGIIFVLEASRLEQRLTLPIVLSTEYNGPLALCTTVLPSVVGIVIYRFVVLPRRRSQRIAHLHSARKALEESEERRERNAVENLLKDLARRHNQLEKSKQGLVILEANYGSTEKDEGTPDLTFDVTIPLQALVRNSQLYIPGGEEAKLSIQGFFDPAPFVPKALRIRYLFREQMHYAEIPDFLPAVLPLLEHRVDGQ